jgi:hypothetical protein
MSGGHWDYADRFLHDAVEDIERMIETNRDETVNQWGDIQRGRHYSDEVLARLREAVAVMRAAATYWHRIDYLVSGDDGEEQFLQRLAKDAADAAKADQMSVMVYPIRSLTKTGSDEASPRQTEEETHG